MVPNNVYPNAGKIVAVPINHSCLTFMDTSPNIPGNTDQSGSHLSPYSCWTGNSPTDQDSDHIWGFQSQRKFQTGNDAIRDGGHQ